MRPAILSLLLALVLAPLSAVAGPTITQLRYTMITGDDAMRGTSDAYLLFWRRGNPDPINLGGTTAGLPRNPWENALPSHSVLTRSRTIDPIDLADITNVGIHFHLPYSTIGHTTFLFNSPDEWHLDGLIVTGLTATGEEYTIYNNPGANYRFIRLNLYLDDHWRLDRFKSPHLDLTGLPDTRVDEFRVSVRTHHDDLRPGSRAFCQVKLRNGWRFEHPLTSRPVHFAEHTAVQHEFRLPRLVNLHDIESVALRYEADNSGGSTDDWNVQGFSVEARRGLTTTEYLVGRTPYLRRMLTENYASPTAFNTSRSETVLFFPYGITIPTDAHLALSMRTGGDDFRGGSNAYLRVFLNDGGFHETKLNGYDEAWGGNSTVAKSIDLPSWIEHRHIRDWGIRFEADRREWMGDDQWTLDSFSIVYDSSLVDSPTLVFGTGRSPHHFPESATWIPDLGIATEPLVEKQTYTYVTEMNLAIPLLQNTPYLIEPPLPFAEWNKLLWESPKMWESLLKAAEAKRFEAFAFGLLPGEKPILEIEPHPPHPYTGGKRFLVRYARLLGVTDAEFPLLHAADLRAWNPVPAADIRASVIADPVLRIEWVELVVSGPTVSGPRNNFRIEAREAADNARGDTLL
ncbi:MAG: hypothetical protein O3A92_16355, partial [Verrucomicrobia bacterium]|nr:hypothetical protein [Verrucomicrobiota bacterium]